MTSLPSLLPDLPLPPIEQEVYIGRNIQPHSASDSTFALASSWYDEYLETHFDCVSVISSLPARVLNLSIPDKIVLYESQPGDKAPYVTLSHCWGTAITLTTTNATLGSRKQQIRLESLPQTFQDAVAITRR